jgi:hypothetical protein
MGWLEHAVFWLIYFGMSRWSLRLERRIAAAARH